MFTAYLHLMAQNVYMDNFYQLPAPPSCNYLFRKSFWYLGSLLHVLLLSTGSQESKSVTQCLTFIRDIVTIVY